MFRIDSPGEIKEISARGVLANMRKETKIKPIKRKKRPVNPVDYGRDINKEFERMFLTGNMRGNRLKRLF